MQDENLKRFQEIVKCFEIDYACDFVDKTSCPMAVKLYNLDRSVCLNDHLNSALAALAEQTVLQPAYEKTVELKNHLESQNLVTKVNDKVKQISSSPSLGKC